jgi:uncharacterized protein YjbJ (UPF0337 family)
MVDIYPIAPGRNRHPPRFGGPGARVETEHRKTDCEETDMAGEIDETKGRIKEAAGALTDDQGLKNEGKVDKATGKVKDVVDTVGDKVKGD